MSASTPTPKEKALELFNEMLSNCWHNECTVVQVGITKLSTVYQRENAKKCAIKAARLTRLTLHELDLPNKNSVSRVIILAEGYWTEVIYELEYNIA